MIHGKYRRFKENTIVRELCIAYCTYSQVSPKLLRLCLRLSVCYLVSCSSNQNFSARTISDNGYITIAIHYTLNASIILTYIIYHGKTSIRLKRYVHPELILCIIEASQKHKSSTALYNTHTHTHTHSYV